MQEWISKIKREVVPHPQPLTGMSAGGQPGDELVPGAGGSSLPQFEERTYVRSKTDKG
jgi:hypothetical protein